MDEVPWTWIFERPDADLIKMEKESSTTTSRWSKHQKGAGSPRHAWEATLNGSDPAGYPSRTWILPILSSFRLGMCLVAEYLL